MTGRHSVARRLIGIVGACLLAGLSVGNAAAAELSYEAYELTASGEQRLIKSETLDYDPERDIKTQRRRDRNGGTFWDRSLALAGGLSIAAHINVQDPVDLPGFGLTVDHKRYPRGFSWEWFNRGEGGEFLKLQQGGRVQVAFQQAAPQNEISRIEFLTDVTLRFCRSMMECPKGSKTHLVIVKAGSVLDLGPSVAGGDVRASAPARSSATAAAL